MRTEEQLIALPDELLTEAQHGALVLRSENAVEPYDDICVNGLMTGEFMLIRNGQLAGVVKEETLKAFSAQA